MRGKPVTGPGPDRGMVFQDYGLFPWLTVRGNIGFGPAARGKPKAEVARIAERFVAMMGLERFADVYPHQLSGGMKQRVAIGRVLANDAHLALMDEPFGALGCDDARAACRRSCWRSGAPPNCPWCSSRIRWRRRSFWPIGLW